MIKTRGTIVAQSSVLPPAGSGFAVNVRRPGPPEPGDLILVAFAWAYNGPNIDSVSMEGFTTLAAAPAPPIGGSFAILFGKEATDSEPDSYRITLPAGDVVTYSLMATVQSGVDTAAVLGTPAAWVTADQSTSQTVPSVTTAFDDSRAFWVLVDSFFDGSGGSCTITWDDPVTGMGLAGPTGWPVVSLGVEDRPTAGATGTRTATFEPADELETAGWAIGLPLNPAPEIGAEVVDTFTRADSTTTLGDAESGQTWAATEDSVWGIDAQRAYCITGNDGETDSLGIATIQAGANDVEVSADITYDGGSTPGLIFRCASVNDWLAVFLDDSEVTLSKRQDGSTSTVPDASAEFDRETGQTYTVRAVAAGATITVSVDGVDLFTYTLSGDDLAYTGADYTAVGMRASSGTRFDNFAATASPEGAATPASVLHIGVGDGLNHFGVDIAEIGTDERTLYPQSVVEAGLNSDPEFTVPADDPEWVQFSARADGAPTDGSNYARSELRPYEPGTDERYGWDAHDGGTHWMRTRVRWTQYPDARPDIVGAQVHSGDDDVVQVRTGLVDGAVQLGLYTYDPDVGDTTAEGRPPFTDSYTLGEAWAFLFLIYGDWLYVFGQDFVQWHYRQPVSELPNTGTYIHKTGCYLQFNDTQVDPSEVGSTLVQHLQHWHTGWADPDNYMGVPTADPGEAATVTAGQVFDRAGVATGEGIVQYKWAVLDAPDGGGAGTALADTAHLTWTAPTVPGEYLLMFGARNAQGWSNPAILAVTVEEAPVSGSLAATLPLPVAALEAGVTVPGTLGGRVPSPTAQLNATADVEMSGELAGALPLPTAGLTAASAASGTLAASLPPLVGALTADTTTADTTAELAAQLPLPIADLRGGTPPPVIDPGELAAQVPVPVANLRGGTPPPVIDPGELAAQVPVPVGDLRGSSPPTQNVLGQLQMRLPQLHAALEGDADGDGAAGVLAAVLPLPVAALNRDLGDGSDGGWLAGVLPVPTAALNGVRPRTYTRPLRAGEPRWTRPDDLAAV